LAYLLRSDLFADCQQQPSHEICGRLTNLAPQPKEITDILDAHFRRRSDVLARLLINEAKIPLIEEFGGDERYRIYSLLGKIAEQCYSHVDARNYLQSAYQIAVEIKDPNKRVEAMINLHNSTFQIDPEKSLEILETAEAICVDKNAEKWLPKVLYERGFTYYLLNDLATSTTWYEKASHEAKRLQDKEMMPIILNDWGYNLLLTGDLPKGRISIRAARDLRYLRFTELSKKLKTKLTQDERTELAQELNDAQKMLGLSYSTLGDLARFSGRLNEAVTRYTEALNIFKKAESHYWQARMHFTRGEAYRRIATADYQAGRNAKSKKLDKQAEEDIDKSLLLCDKYGFRRDTATAYRRLGRLYHDRMFRTSDPETQLDLLQKANALFTKALSIAKELNDPIEIFENLTELAFLGDDYLDIVKAHKPHEIELAKKTSHEGNEALRTQLEKYSESTKNPIYFFPVFYHLLEIEQAAFFFALGEYEQALPLYIKGYVGMAQNRGYGVARYLQHIDHLISHLHELASQDKELAEHWCNELLAAWEKAGLTDKRSELPQEIEMFLNTAFL
jgi:tetratricopeptide (TPR) repeat protein